MLYSRWTVLWWTSAPRATSWQSGWPTPRSRTPSSASGRCSRSGSASTPGTRSASTFTRRRSSRAVRWRSRSTTFERCPPPRDGVLHRYPRTPASVGWLHYSDTKVVVIGVSLPAFFRYKKNPTNVICLGRDFSCGKTVDSCWIVVPSPPQEQPFFWGVVVPFTCTPLACFVDIFFSPPPDILTRSKQSSLCKRPAL